MAVEKTFHFIQLVLIQALYENRNRVEKKDKKGKWVYKWMYPTQAEMLGDSPEFNGLINKLLEEFHIINEDGSSNAPHRAEKFKSKSNFNRWIQDLRDAGLIIKRKKGAVRTPYILTDLGAEVGKTLSEFDYYDNMPIGAYVTNNSIEYIYEKAN